MLKQDLVDVYRREEVDGEERDVDRVSGLGSSRWKRIVNWIVVVESPLHYVNTEFQIFKHLPLLRGLSPLKVWLVYTCTVVPSTLKTMLVFGKIAIYCAFHCVLYLSCLTHYFCSSWPPSGRRAFLLMRRDCEALDYKLVFVIHSAGSRKMVLSQKEKETAKLGLPVFTVSSSPQCHRTF